MQPTRTYTSMPIGSLFSAHIFGSENPISKQSSFRSKPKRVPATREERVTFTALTEAATPVLCVLPYLTTPAFAETMDNYRLYVAHYNEMILELNDTIVRENAKIKKLKATNQLSEVQKSFSAIFYKKNSRLKAKEFNQLADAFNAERGLTIEKKKYRTVKYASEIVFQQLLYSYSIQLAKYSNEYLKLGVTEISPIIQIKINSHHVTNLNRNGVRSIDVCNATIRNHRAILEEAGVLVDYLYRGHKTGVKSHINSQILVVFDAKTQNLTVPDNQLFTYPKRKEFTDNNEATRTIITVNKTENSKADFPILGTASPDLSSFFYKNILAQDEKTKLGGGAKSVKVSETLSEKLLETTLKTSNFASSLAQGDFFAHQSIDKEILYKECYNGTLIREEFLQVIKTEFFKKLSKIYRQSTPYAGSYQKALNDFDQRFYVSNGNGKFLVRKELMVDMLQKYFWMINKAQRWFIKTGIRPLNPHDYLDRTRTHKKEIGFDYLEKAHAKHLKELESKPLKAKKAAKNALLRKKAIDNDKKFNQKWNDFDKQRISLDGIIEYVDTNLPPAFMQTLSDKLIKKNAFKLSKYDC